MSQEAAPVGPSTEDPALSPLNKPWTFPGGHGRNQLHVRPGTRPVRRASRDPVCAGRKRVLRKSLVKVPAPRVLLGSPEATAHPVVLGLQAVGQSQLGAQPQALLSPTHRACPGEGSGLQEGPDYSARHLSRKLSQESCSGWGQERKQEV